MNALLLSALFGVLMMFSGIWVRRPGILRGIAVTGMGLVLTGNLLDLNGVRLLTLNTAGMMEFDRFALLLTTIAILSTLIYFLLSARDIGNVGIHYSDYLALIFFILCGITLVASFRSLLILFLGIEIISIPLYILTGSDKRNLKSNEAALKYFLLGAFSTGLMLLGIAFWYGATATFQTALRLGPDQLPSSLLIASVLLLFFSMAFKASLAPFHFWTPDVYDGAPTVFTSFMATVVKAAVFMAFIRLFEGAFGTLQAVWKLPAAIAVVLTLFVGNITAVFQQSVKRMLAYSSIAQAGFMMLALLALNTDAKEGLLLYLAAYSFATIGVFAVLIKMTDYTFSGFDGLARHEPLLAGVTTVFLLSLAGIPLTAGFLAKFYMLKATLAAGGYLWLAIFAVLMAAVSVYYYFRVIQAMYFREGAAPAIRTTAAFRWSLVALAALVVLLGIWPDLLLSWMYF
jgi:NADH-quinone oxidoreductase subunit N